MKNSAAASPAPVSGDALARDDARGTSVTSRLAAAPAYAGKPVAGTGVRPKRGAAPARTGIKTEHTAAACGQASAKKLPREEGLSPKGKGEKDATAASAVERLLAKARKALGQYTLVHDIPGRLRLRPAKRRGGSHVRPGLAKTLALLHPALQTAEIQVSPVTGSVLVRYENPSVRSLVLTVLSLAEDRTGPAPEVSPSGAAQPASGPAAADEVSVRNPIPGKMRSYFYPRVLVHGLAIWRSLPYIWKGIKAVFSGRVNLDALDGAALLVCILRRDFKSLGSIIFFFALGEYLADWTRKKSRASLAESLALNIDHVWVRSGGLERQIPIAEIRKGDHVVARAGSVLPVDGVVAEGDGMVNQASMTGEALPVHRTAGSSVYAGTVLVEGELVVAATKVGGETRITSILRSIEESENAKASIQGRYERIADAIVPYNFLLSGAVYAATRDPMRAGSVLLVDYSCAIRLATPLTIFTAMREAAEHGVLIKGGKFMEAVADADVVVFDKTGTLTEAKPTVVDVIPFGGRARAEVLRLAACLEEHFVHPVGQAVVRAADAENLQHREEHTRVEFVVAHGIASHWRGGRALIGSEHFVLEDEGIPATPEQRAVIDDQAARGRSVLYLATGGELAGLILIEDEIRADAAAVVEALRQDGVKRVIMLTGDGELTARNIAARAGITEFRSRLLPEDKAAFIASLKREGHTIMMVGDGINDSPALSAADVGVAMAEGADMAREAADMVLVNGELAGLLLAREISRRALARVRRNFRTSVLWNSLFLAGGLLGILMPGLSALLHNATTAAIAVSSLRPLLSPFDPRPALPAVPATEAGDIPGAEHMALTA